MQRIIRGAAVVGVLVGGQAAFSPSPASAAADIYIASSGTTINVGHDNARPNHLTISTSGGFVVFQEFSGNTLFSSGGCTNLTATKVQCPAARIRLIDIYLGRFDDQIFSSATIATNVTAGAGNDVIHTGSGGGTIIPGEGRDAVVGGLGNEFIIDGPGADRYSGGNGRDIVSYQQATAGVVVSKNSTADDGRPGEGDDVRDDVDIVYGSPFNDTLVGGAGIDVFHGLGGNDIVNGGAGNDSVAGGDGADTLRGEAGNDVLEGIDGAIGNDNLAGGAGTDKCSGDFADIKSGCES
ncbi:MAG TPA: hypothetical protein VF755_14735 [Catenuloplanes sp.]